MNLTDAEQHDNNVKEQHGTDSKSVHPNPDDIATQMYGALPSDTESSDGESDDLLDLVPSVMPPKAAHPAVTPKPDGTADDDPTQTMDSVDGQSITSKKSGNTDSDPTQTFEDMIASGEPAKPKTSTRAADENETQAYGLDAVDSDETDGEESDNRRESHVFGRKHPREDG